MADGGGEGIPETVSRVWGFLDRLAETDPDQYKSFIEQAMREREEFLDPPRPVFCFSTGVRGKEKQKLFVNVCEWKRIPPEKVDAAAKHSQVPVKGGVLRHLVEEGKRQANCLLVDVAFSPSFLELCMTENSAKEAVTSLTLDFLDSYLSIIADRNTRIVSKAKFKGPEPDIALSLEQQSPELITKESWLDLRDSLLSSLKKESQASTDKDTNGLPPLFPGQQPDVEVKGHPQTQRLIEEVQSPMTHQKKRVRNREKKDEATCHGSSNNKKRERSDLPERETERNSEREKEREKGREERESERETERKGESLAFKGSSDAAQAEIGGGGSEGSVQPENKVVIGEEGGVRVVMVTVKLPEVPCTDQIDLDSSETTMCLTTAAGNYSLSVLFPFHINPDHSKATFNKRSHTLRIQFPATDQN